MLKYLIIPLSDNAVSFCHYEVLQTASSIMTPETLKPALVWAMKENVYVQFIYPSCGVSEEIEALVETVDHISIVPADIVSSDLRTKAQAVVFNTWEQISAFDFKPEQSYIIRTTFDNLLSHQVELQSALKKADRVNVIITDVENFKADRTDCYRNFLESLIPDIVDQYSAGHQVQFNLLTDRTMLNGMNNCNAGHESLTLAPNGKFYVCPAFYIDGLTPVGDPENGCKIPNEKLYGLNHAPICRICDAFQCKRCVWLNQRLTLEVNTPGHEQCVMAHIERNASRKLLEELRKINPDYMLETDIPKINYLDPFDNITI